MLEYVSVCVNVCECNCRSRTVCVGVRVRASAWERGVCVDEYHGDLNMPSHRDMIIVVIC